MPVFSVPTSKTMTAMALALALAMPTASYAQSDAGSAAEEAAQETEQAAEEAQAEATDEATDEAAVSPPPPEMLVNEQSEGETLSSDVIGASIVNSTGESIGDIQAILITESGVKAAVVGVGGFLGIIGVKEVGINWDELTETEEGYSVNATEEQLKAAPDFVSLERKEAAAEAERQRQEAEAAAQQQSSGGTGGTTQPATE